MSSEPSRTCTWPVTVVVWLALLSFLALFARQVWLLHVPQCAFEAWFLIEYELIVGAICVLGLVVIWRAGPKGLQLTMRQAFMVLGLFAFLCGTDVLARQKQPLLLCFRASQPQLDQLADRLLDDPDGGSVRLNETAGYYQIVSGCVVDGVVILRLDDSQFPPFYYGFLRLPAGGPDFESQDLGLEHSGFLRLSEDWYVFYSIYLLMKTGWS